MPTGMLTPAPSAPRGPGDTSHGDCRWLGWQQKGKSRSLAPKKQRKEPEKYPRARHWWDRLLLALISGLDCFKSGPLSIYSCKRAFFFETELLISLPEVQTRRVQADKRDR